MNKSEVNSQRYILILSVLLLIGGLMYALRSVLLPFVVGIAVAYFLDPLVNRLTRYPKISRTTATGIVLLLFLLILLPVLFLLGGAAISQISDFISNMPEYINNFGAKIKICINKLQPYFPTLNFDNQESLLRNFGESAKPLVKLLQKIISNGFAFVNVI